MDIRTSFSTIVLVLLFVNLLICGVLAMPLDDSYLDETYSIDSDFDVGDDYEYDIEDYGDEESKFPCLGEGYAIELSLLCDNHTDCPDGSDEVKETCMLYRKEEGADAAAYVLPPLVKPTNDFDVDYESCSEDEFQCPLTLGLCVPKSSKCDGESDCPDGEDELNCGETSTALHTHALDSTVITTIPVTKQLGTTSVIETSASSLSNKSQTDESTTNSSIASVLNTTQPAITSLPTTGVNLSTDNHVNFCDLEHGFQCRTNPEDCVPRNLLCDGFHDCADGSDESECGCGEGEYQCVSGKCISASYRCDGYNDCGDYSDEIIDCAFLPNIGQVRTIAQISTAAPATTAAPHSETFRIETTSSVTPTTEETLTNRACNEVTNICEENICRNGGTCHLLDKGDFVCHCPPGYSGTLCHVASHCTNENLQANPSGNHSSSLKSVGVFKTLTITTYVVLILLQGFS